MPQSPLVSPAKITSSKLAQGIHLLRRFHKFSNNDSARLAESGDAALRGVTRGLVRRLCAEAREDDAWGELELRGERRVLVEGLLDRIDVGEGKAYILRAGPPDEEMTRPWREFLLQVFTNLGIQCGPAESTARGKE